MKQEVSVGAAAELQPIAVRVDDIVQMSGVPRTRVYEEIANGKLKSFRLGHRRLALVKEVEAWLHRMAKEGAQ